MCLCKYICTYMKYIHCDYICIYVYVSIYAHTRNTYIDTDTHRHTMRDIGRD